MPSLLDRNTHLNEQKCYDHCTGASFRNKIPLFSIVRAYAISEQGRLCPFRECQDQRIWAIFWDATRDWYCHLDKFFGPTGRHQTRNSPLPRVGAIPNASAIFKMRPGSLILWVFRTAWDSASITPVVSKWCLQFLSHSVIQRNVEWVGDDCYVVTGQKFPRENESVIRCVAIMQTPIPPQSSGRSLCTL
jgi:hypothetical protein